MHWTHGSSTRCAPQSDLKNKNCINCILSIWNCKITQLYTKLWGILCLANASAHLDAEIEILKRLKYEYSYIFSTSFTWNDHNYPLCTSSKAEESTIPGAVFMKGFEVPASSRSRKLRRAIQTNVSKSSLIYVIAAVAGGGHGLGPMKSWSKRRQYHAGRIACIHMISVCRVTRLNLVKLNQRNSGFKVKQQ